jgi:hypothetical protein
MRLLMNLLSVSLLLIVATTVSAAETSLSTFDEAGIQLRYGSTAAWMAQDESGSGVNELETTKPYAYKSPGKAFALSVLVPGLGQYYYGSRVKPWLFFGAEVTAWVLYFKWDGDYNDLTTAFEQFQRTHWSRNDYTTYLQYAYDGATDDDSIDATEISHHLPDSETGQYFEMTGKYDQFAWGWDDALRDGEPLGSFATAGDSLRIVNVATTPYSANRLTYVDMRKDANDKYDQARAMILVSLANRLISGFEAFLTTKRHNKHAAGRSDVEFSLVDLRASVRSYHSPSDTPFLTATVRF